MKIVYVEILKVVKEYTTVVVEYTLNRKTKTKKDFINKGKVLFLSEHRV